MNSTTDLRLTKGVAPEHPRICRLCRAALAVPHLTAPDRFHWRSELYELYRCQACGCVSLVNAPEPHEMGIHYDAPYHVKIAHAGESRALKRWTPYRRLILEQKKAGAILDVGCSSGSFLSTMSGPAWRRFGIEMENSTAEKARLLADAEVFAGDVERAPFHPETFDVITCFDVVEHLYNPMAFLENICRWLKKGGICLIVLPNIDSCEARLFSTYWYGLELPRHLSHFSPRSLRFAAAKAGLREVYLRTGSCYVERSIGYLMQAAARRLGFQPPPPSKPRNPTFLWKAIRRILRTVILVPLTRLAKIAGVGPSIVAIFSKP